MPKEPNSAVAVRKSRLKVRPVVWEGWSSTSGRRTSWRSATVVRTQPFVRGITDPIPVTWRADGLGLMLAWGSAEPVV